MATTRAEADMLFTRALAMVRQTGTDASGRSRADATALAQELYNRQPGNGGFNRQDIKAAVNRAIKAREAGLKLTEQPNAAHAVLKRELPNKPVLNRSRGSYEFRVVVQLDNGIDKFDTLVVIQSRRLLTGAEIFARAGQAFWDGPAQEQRYRNAVSRHSSIASPDYFIVSASYFDPTRGGTQ